MKRTKKILALVLALAMVMAIAAPAFAEETKYTVEETDDGWMKVTQEGGVTLGYSQESGVQLLTVDGYAFKDLDRDGELDVYEDWREDDKVRAKDLSDKLSVEEMIPLFTFGGWSSFGFEIEEDNTDYAYVLNGGRGGVTRSSGSQGNTTMAVSWMNALQALCEKTGNWGIPATVSIDPNNMSNTIDNMALGSTFSTDMAFEVAKQVSKMYRSVGITMLLGPQSDLATTPVVCRMSGDLTEDPALNRDLVDAFISGMQSTFAEDGTDLGWGEDSIYCIAKHYAGAGAPEGGRNDHFQGGGFDVFPGNNFEAHLISYFDGAFNLTRSITKESGLMPNYATSYSADGSLGEINGGAYSAYKMGLLEEAGYDGFIVTDWQITTEGGAGAYFMLDADGHTDADRFGTVLDRGSHAVGGTDNIEGAKAGYEWLKEQKGEEYATAKLRNAAYHFIMQQMYTGQFDNAYVELEKAQELCWNGETAEVALAQQVQAVIMLKNTDNTIAAATGEKKTVYIPMVFTAATEGNSSAAATPASWGPSMDMEVASEYFNVITDTVLEPSGKDADGNAVYTEADIQRASAEDLASCDMALVSISSAMTESSQEQDGSFTPVSLQFGEYTADTAREVSIAGYKLADGTQENRGYKGKTVGKASNYSDLEMLQSVAAMAPDSCKVVTLIEGKNPMVLSEVEPLSDVLFWYWGNGASGSGWFYDEALYKVVAGEVEPSALLNIQMPANMETVEAELEDVPRDCECYVDAVGNVYDFAFGLNWSGVINDERVAKYNVAPITECANLDFHYAN